MIRHTSPVLKHISSAQMGFKWVTLSIYTLSSPVGV